VRDLRADAVRCARAAIRAADPAPLVREALAVQPVPAAVTIVAVGKGAAAMAEAALAFPLGSATGLVVAPQGAAPTAGSLAATHLRCMAGGHPVPTQDSLTAARQVAQLADALGGDDHLLVLLSGGASALVTLPPAGVSLADIRVVTAALLDAGAPIGEVNCVRKHLDELKGGRLAARAFPAPSTTLVLSDAPGNALDIAGSGPTVPDPTTSADAVAILRRYSLWDAVPAVVRTHLESASAESVKRGDPRLSRSRATVIGDNALAMQGAARAARALGYDARPVEVPLSGEARDAGARIVREAIAAQRGTARPVALVYGGETTVTVRGTGRGGRNQELALAAAMALQGTAGIALAALGTDGVDGASDAAGAAADGATIERARERGLDAAAALANNDTHGFWQRLGDAIVTGPTGTNVLDVVVVTVMPPTA